MWAILQRELRAEARRPVSHWLRVGSAALFFVLLLMSLHGLGNVEPVCRGLFPILHCLLLAVSWLVAPLLMVEAISREKREGTLELLLLTPLTLSAVLRAKMAVIMARVLVLVIGALPVLVFTVLLGGVGREELLLMLLLQAGSLILAMAIGLLGAVWGRTQIFSMAITGALLVVVAGGAALLLFHVFQSVIGGTFAPGLWPKVSGLGAWIIGAGRLIGDADGVWSQTIGTIPRVLIDGVLWLFLSALLAAVFLATLISVWARMILHGSIHPEESWLAGIKFSPGRAMKRTSRRKRYQWLHKNPVKWLMCYRQDIRLFRWVGAVIVALAQIFGSLFTSSFDGWILLQSTIVWGLVAFIVLAAAASFRREREDGALEMLLVTPLTPRELLIGRVKGMWWQFGPAFITWTIGVCLFHQQFWHFFELDSVLCLVAWSLAMMIFVPAIGLEAAFQFRGYWRSVGATALGTMGVSGMIFTMGLMDRHPFGLTVVSIAILLVIGGLCAPGFLLRFETHRNGENLRSAGGFRRRSSHRHRSRLPSNRRFHARLPG